VHKWKLNKTFIKKRSPWNLELKERPLSYQSLEDGETHNIPVIHQTL